MKSTMRSGLMLAATVVALLAGCGQQQVGYQIDGRNHSLSVTRDQPYPMADWEVYLVVSRFPECQRRHKLKSSAADGFKMDVYRVQPGVYILNRGKLWFVAETKECQMQQYKEPPPEPGELIGTFVTKDGELTWDSKEKPKAEQKAPAPAATKAQ